MTKRLTVAAIAALVSGMLLLTPFVTAKTVDLEVMVNAWAPSVIQAIQDGLKRFEEQNPGVKVTVTTNTAQNNFLVRYAGGAAPDVLAAGLNIGGYGDQGIVMPLNDLVEKHGLRKQIVEEIWNTGVWKGNIYGVPAIDNGPRLGMVWNQDMLDEVGLSVKSNATMNWDTFFNYADRLTKVDANGVITRLGYDPRNGQNSRLFTNAPLWDAVYLPKAVNEQPAINHPNLVKMVETIAERVYSKYSSWKFNTAWYDYFAANKVATLNLGVYAPGEIASRNKDQKIVVTWPPSLSNKKVQQVTGWVLGIPSGVKDPELSFRLIEFMSTDVQFQTDMYYKTGFFGNSRQFIAKLLGEIRDPNRLWYINSLSQANFIDAVSPDPLIGKPDSLFMTAATNVWAGKQDAKAALDEANRLFAVELKANGRL